MRRSRWGVILVGCLLLGTGFLLQAWQPAPSFERVRSGYQSSDSILYDRRGSILHSIRVSDQQRRLAWVDLDDVSPRLMEAVVEAEDQRFYRHSGVDEWALLGVLADYVRDGRLRGASTITMQLAGLLEKDLRSGPAGRSWSQKLRQVVFAGSLEAKWSKSQILEAYLNLLSYRGELEGIAAAARALFNKDPHGLTQPECLILAALIRAPNASVDEVRKRAEQLAGRLDRESLKPQIEETVRRSLNGTRFIQSREDWAPAVAERLLKRSGADRSATSTLDREVQMMAVETLRKYLAGVSDQNVQDGSVLVVENETGDVLAYVGNGDPFTSARYVDGVQAFRQAGSTLKPMLYGLAFERRLITPASLLQDGPLDVAVYGGIYQPSNYDNRFRGLVAARTALASSLNIPAVRLLQVVGLEDFTRLLQELDFAEIREPLFYGPSLALGTADITLWGLVNAYRTLARGGVWSPLRLDLSRTETRSRRIFSPSVTFLISDILSDREARSATFGLSSPLSTRFWSAVKTGTSKDMRDNWCVGFTARYTVGVWIGNFSGRPMWNVSGVTGAAPIWSEVISRMHVDLPSQPPTPPPGLTRQQVHWVDETAQSEWFLEGTEMDEVEPAPRPARYRIAYPAQGTTIALDPDIPSRQQKVFFEANPDPDFLDWRLNGEPLSRPGIWTPHPGKHQLELVDSEGQVLDEIWFQVTG